MAHRAGTVAIIGRPNVGKSTLLNALVGTKVAIVTPKPQTTRTRVVGIRTTPAGQAVFVDTPGIHDARSTLNRRMVETARRALEEADATLLVVDASAGVGAGDRALAAELAGARPPTIVVLNKMDRMPRARLLPSMAEMGALLPGREIVPTSATRGDNVDLLLDLVTRELVFLATRDEVPYRTTTLAERFEERPEKNLVVIAVTILVERPSHKAIVIGTRGERLREIGTRAREGLEALLGTRVFLELFVRVEPGWTENPRRLAELGL